VAPSPAEGGKMSAAGTFAGREAPGLEGDAESGFSPPGHLKTLDRTSPYGRSP
jgi:hypothetical protein